MADDFIKQIRAAFPFPWNHAVFPNGVVKVMDAEGKEVPLFTMVEFVMFLTGVMSNQKEKAA